MKEVRIEELLSRFIDGETSVEEETVLADFFRKATDGDKPADMPEEDWEGAFDNIPAASPEDRIVLTACMDKLKDDERQIIMLHAVSGFKHREIAEFLSLPLSTVLSKYHRALKKLRVLLTEGK